MVSRVNGSTTILVRAAMALACGAALTACGSMGNDDDEGRKGGEVENELVGDWVSSCENQGPLGIIDLVSVKHEMNFGLVPGDVEKKVHRFSDKDCMTALYDETIVASYGVVGDATEAGAQNLNITVHKVTVMPHTGGAAKLNDVRFCDATDWADGVQKDVTGKSCDGKALAEGAVIFDIYDVDGNNLFLGADSFFENGSSPDARPAKLDREHPLLKQ
jgi:hypothetical protein